MLSIDKIVTFSTSQLRKILASILNIYQTIDLRSNPRSQAVVCHGQDQYGKVI